MNYKKIITPPLIFILSNILFSYNPIKPAKENNKNDNDKEIVIGTTLDLSRIFKSDSEFTKQGISKVFEKINKEGGIQGKQLRLIVLDDEYNPLKARQNIEIFLNKYKTDIVFSPMGLVPLEGYLDLVKEKKVLVIFPSTGSPKLRDPSLSHILHFRGSYNEICYTLVQYAIEKLESKKIVFISANDTTAPESKYYIPLDLRPSKYKVLQYEPNTTNFEKEIKTINDFVPDTLAFFCPTRAATEILRQMQNQNLVGKKLIGVELGDDLFQAFLKEQGLTNQFVDTKNLPNPETLPNQHKLEIVKEFQHDFGPRASDLMLFEAYIGASLFVDILKKINGPITKEAIIKTAESLKNYNFKGININFDPETRQLSNQIWIDKFGEKEWELITLKKAAPQEKETKPIKTEIKPKEKKGYRSLR